MKLMITALAFILSSNVFAFGGTTAGGGDTTPERKASDAEIQTAIRMSKFYISAYLNALYVFEVHNKKGVYCDNVCELKRKLLYAKPNIFDVVNTIKIEVKNNDFCYDNSGNRKDGSVYAKRSNAICISAFSLKEKLSVSNYEVQTAALVFHELTHLTGTNENEAVTLQNNMVNELSNSVAGNVRERTLQVKKDLARSVERLDMDKNYLIQSSNGSCQQVNATLEALDRIEYNFHVTHSFNVMAPEFSKSFYSAYVKAYLVKSYLCANDGVVSQEEREEETMRLEYLFGNQKSISTATSKMNYTKLADKNITARKISNKTDLKNELDDVSNLLSEVVKSLTTVMTRNYFELI